MITSIVRYRLPAHINAEDCRNHFHSIAPGFGQAKGLLRKQFIWSEQGIAGGVYQWETIEDAKSFYQGPWLSGILARYNVYPEIEYFQTFALFENPGGIVTALD